MLPSIDVHAIMTATSTATQDGCQRLSLILLATEPTCSTIVASPAAESASSSYMSA